MTQPERGSVDRVKEELAAVLARVDRRDPLGEAQVAALETALLLMRADRLPPETGGSEEERTELVREALGAARATVMATGVALIQRSDGRTRHGV